MACSSHKVFDVGVERRLVRVNDNEALLFTCMWRINPGDSYLWYLDENQRPVGFEMWVSIVPIGGLHATWNQWKRPDICPIT